MQNNQTTSYKEATGVIQYNMTNDYMFRYILQKNEKVLRGLICSLLHLKPEQIKTVEITNPINLSDSIDGKEFILDINISLNDDTRINLEMQVEDKYDWPDRSLSYLCRSFDQLYQGQKYPEALPVIHIGFLNYSLFPNNHEFYSTNMLMNVKTHRIFNDKFKLSVVDLTQIERATEEDKAYHIDYWARLFKAKTWEDIKMLAEKNEYLKEAAQSVYVANADEIIQQKCYAREEAIRYERSLKAKIAERDKAIAEKDAENAELKAENAELKAKLASLQKQVDAK